MSLRRIRLATCMLLASVVAGCSAGSDRGTQAAEDRAEPARPPVTAPASAPGSAGSVAPTPAAPRLVVYYNSPTDPVLAGAEAHPYTHYILSFLVPDGKGGVEPSAHLEKALADPAAIRRVRAAGKKVLVSVGGGEVGGHDWLTLGRNATAVAEQVAGVVETYELDGVDLDVEAVPYERRSSFEPYARAVIALTVAISDRLPGKLLTHAPQPPYLCEPGSFGACPEDSLYAAILAGAGDRISWLNMQYYSNPPLTSADVDEVASYESIVRGWKGFPGLPAERLVLGKPYSPDVSGHEPLDELVSDLLEPLVARHGRSFGGFMAWQLDQDPDGEHARALSRALDGR